MQKAQQVQRTGVGVKLSYCRNSEIARVVVERV